MRMIQSYFLLRFEIGCLAMSVAWSSSSSLADTAGVGEPPHISPPTHRFAPDPTLSADQCLSFADEAVDEDRFATARKWVEAAENRAKTPEMQKRVRRILPRLSMLGKPAPRLDTDRWISGKRPNISELKGKVILLNFFETIRPESRHAIQQVMTWADRFAKRGLKVLSIVVVREQAAYQQPEQIQQFVTSRNFNHPVAIDAANHHTFDAYGGADTPYIALIDRDGRVRWLGPFDQVKVTGKVLKLLAETIGRKLHERTLTMPTTREGRDRIDQHAPRLRTRLWINTPDGKAPRWTGRPRLIRFFTDSCPYCSVTVPALNHLFKDYANKGLLVVGIFHPKPTPREVTRAELQHIVKRMELLCPVTADADWSYLRKIWLDTGDRNYTSVTFLIDRKGMIRYIHPGPEFFPSEDPTQRQQNEDYQAIRRAIQIVLAE